MQAVIFIGVQAQWEKHFLQGKVRRYAYPDQPGYAKNQAP